MYLSTKSGGLGFNTIEVETEIQFVRRYSYLMENPELSEARAKFEKLHKAGWRTPIGDYEYVCKKYNIDRTLDKIEVIRTIKDQDQERRQSDWAKLAKYPQKVMEFQERIEFPALCDTRLNTEKLSFLNAAAEEQIQGLRSHDEGNNQCRKGCNSIESAYHVVSACSRQSYNARHDQVVHWILKECLQHLGAPSETCNLARPPPTQSSVPTAPSTPSEPVKLFLPRRNSTITNLIL